MYADIPRWVSITVYVFLSWRYLRIGAAPPAGNVQPPMRKWLQQFITVFLAFQLLWLVFLVPYIVPASSNWLLRKFDWYPIYIPLAVMIYWLGLKGYFLSLTPETEKKKKVPTRDIAKEVVGQTIHLLQKSMEKDKLYLNPELNLDAVAKHTGIVAKTISAVLNQHRQTSFNEWVNGYRISEFKQKIHDGSLQQLTISAIATECGFSSQATFQRIFKQSQGVTPSEYLKTARPGE
jgi:AraC-like DNA-binding protein